MLGHSTLLACLFEATARKVGNVHRYRDFEDLTYLDFVLSATAIAPIIELAPQQSIGETILLAVQATRAVVKTNTNLGIILLLAPLAKANSRAELETILNSMTVEDSRLVYRAIRLSMPGGMGEVAEQDIRDEPTLPLLELMRLAESRDAIASTYVDRFKQFFGFGVPAILEGVYEFGNLEAAILFTQLNWLARQGDSLVQRKRGDAENALVQMQAREILALGLDTDAGRTKLTEFDRWLREVGHARNPGTTADLVTACLFVALRERKLTGLEPFPWPAWTG
jgi:triphosphoribosyl-dephospho-CoA synthase